MQPRSKITTPQANTLWLWLAGVSFALSVVIAFVTKEPHGEWLVVLYAVAAIFRHLPSRTLFMLAAGALVLVPLPVLLFGAWHAVSAAVASYVFILLCAATLRLTLELRRNKNMTF